MGDEASTNPEIADFRKRLESWKGDKLQNFDSDSEFRSARVKKYGSRDGFEKYLNDRIKKQLADQLGDISPSSPKRQESGYDEKSNTEIHYLQPANRELLGDKAAKFKSGDAHDSDDEDEDHFRGHRAVNC